MHNVFLTETAATSPTKVKVTFENQFAILVPHKRENETLPNWCLPFLPLQSSAKEYLSVLPEIQGEFCVEGPITDSTDWEAFWRFYAFPRKSLYETITRQIAPFLLTTEGVSKSQLVCVSLLGSEYVVRLARVSESGAFSISRIRPHLPPLDPELLAHVSNKSGNRFLLHGVGYDWKPKGGLGWHALDFHVHAATDTCMQNMVWNLEKGCHNHLLIYGIDFVNPENILRLFSLHSTQLKIILVASALVNVDPKLVESIDTRCVILLNTAKSYLKPKPDKNIPLPDVTGLPLEALEKARTYFITPLTHAERLLAFSQILPNLMAPKILIYGPPQSGKSTLAKWIATSVLKESPNISLFEVHASSLFSKYLGSSEKRIQKFFRKAAISAPSIVLIEGIHSLCPSRDLDDDGEIGVTDTYQRVLATFLMSLDGLETRNNKVSVIGTSLVGPEMLDPAAVRPGRMETWISLPALDS